MYSITYKNKKYLCRNDETILDVCLRNGLTVPFSCKEGICHVCLMRSEKNLHSAHSQKGLKTALLEKNYFKICQCVPAEDMQISLPKPEDITSQAIVAAQTQVLRLQAKAKADSIAKEQQQKNTAVERDAPPPDAEMWAAMQDGVLLKQILTTFYTWVFDDEILRAYFSGVTKQRLIEKVYSFLYQIFTGKKVFFGERPRNGHHWMVISEEIFAHREALMEKALIQHKLAPHLIQRWLAYEAWYKDDIVKKKPINKVLFGEEIPYEGFESMQMDVSTLCDSCQGEVNIGDTVRYHVRMGTVYCEKCTDLT